MSTIMKHVGKLGEEPCVVVFRTLPNDEEHCLIVETRSLADRVHDELMDAVQSVEAQSAKEISEVLNRRSFSNGSVMLQHLHFNKLMKKVSVDLVSLTPTPSHSVPLKEVNQEIKKLDGGYTPPKNDGSHLQKGSVMETDPTLNQQRVEQSENTTDNGDDPESVARGIMMQAELMEQDARQLLADAQAKREQAIAMDSSLAQDQVEEDSAPTAQNEDEKS